jgi:hypothetical protein
LDGGNFHFIARLDACQVHEVGRFVVTGWPFVCLSAFFYSLWPLLALIFLLQQLAYVEI